MTTLASRVRLGLGTWDDGWIFWSARASAYAAIVCLTTTSLPAGPALALSRWFDPRNSHSSLTPALALAALAALVAFACTEQRARLRGGRALGLAAAVVAALCSLDALRVGGGELSAAFAAVVALLLERRGTRHIIAVAIVTMVWCNVSPVGIIAPAIALTFALGATYENPDPTLCRSAWYAAGACALATLATPAFAASPAQAFAALRFDRTLVGVVAIHPIEVAPAAYRVGFTLVVLAFLALGSGARVRAGDASLVVLATLLALANGAYLAVFGVLVAPVLARSAYESLARRDPRDLTYRAADYVFGVAAIALSGVLAIACAPRAEAALAARPFALANVAFATRTPHRFFCADVDWCSYVRASGPRGTSVLMDGQVAAFAADVVEAQRSIEHASAGWRASLDRRRIDAMLVRRDRALATLLRMRGGWRVVASDDTAELYVRTKLLR